MAKKQLYFTEAERLYVNEQMTIAEIASRLNLGEKTVRLWKEEGDWEKKRRQYLQQKKAFHEELYGFARLLMQKIKEDIEAGVEVSAGRYFTLTRMLPLIFKMKDFEDVMVKAEGGKATLTPEEIVKLVEKEVLKIG